MVPGVERGGTAESNRVEIRRRGRVAHRPGSSHGPPPVHDVGRFVYEPDPAVIRAHLVSTVVAEIDGWLLDPHLA